MINQQGHGALGWVGPYQDGEPLFTIYEVIIPIPGLLSQQRTYGHHHWTRMPDRYELEACSACLFMWPWTNYEVE